MIWNSALATYYDSGKRAYSFGDIIPKKVLAQMGKETVDEYTARGWIVDDKVAVGAEKDALFARAESLGLKPHYKAGIPKLEAMIEDHEALQELKKEALALGIDPSDDVTFAELLELVGEKNKEAELVNETDE